MASGSLKGLCPKQQLHVFEQADVLVSTHSNALVNVVFMVPHSAVVELFPPMYSSPFFSHLSASERIYYAAVTGYMEEPKICPSGRECGVAFYRDVVFSVKSEAVETAVMAALHFVNGTKY